MSILGLRRNRGKAVGLMVIAVAFILVSRFAFLNWGAPWYFHPDERNIASAVSRIYFQIQNRDKDVLNPDFFAYGGLPIYFILIILLKIKSYFSNSDPFVMAIIISRVISAIWMATIPWLTQKIAKNWNPGVAKSVFWLSVFCVGYMQFARFGTFESWLTGTYLLILLLSISLVKKWTGGKWLGLSLVMGMAVAVKLPSIYLVPMLGLPFTVQVVNLIKRSKHWRVRMVLIINMLISGLMAGIIMMTIFVLTNPYAFKEEIAGKYTNNLGTYSLESMRGLIKIASQPNKWTQPGLGEVFNKEFLHSINVEGDIAKGKIKVFYTRHFAGTEKGSYQLVMIMPWLTSVPVVIFALLGGGFMGWLVWRKHWPSVILVLWMSLQLAFILPLYVKWTRYMVPVIPGFLICASLAENRIKGLIEILWDGKKGRRVRKLLGGGINFLWAWHLVYTCMFLVTFTQKDTRIEAADWMNQVMNKNVNVLSEVYDLGILPFNNVINPAKINLFNFYDLDENPSAPDVKIEDADVIIITSRRIWKHTTDNPELFPRAAKFYSQLFGGELGFIKIQEFSNYPRIGPWIVYDETRAEETFSVFDHPRVQIWIKQARHDDIIL